MTGAPEPAVTNDERVARLVKDHAGALLDYFVRRVPDREDAADLLGETLVVVWRKARSVPSDAVEARMWMFGIARRVLSQGWRSRARRHALTNKLARHLAELAPVEEQDHSADVRAAVTKLQAVDQEIIRLVYWDGFTLVEAARHLGMNAATVRSRHARARSILQTLLHTERV